jgi:hypothetical protein
LCRAAREPAGHDAIPDADGHLHAVQVKPSRQESEDDAGEAHERHRAGPESIAALVVPFEQPAGLIVEGIDLVVHGRNTLCRFPRIPALAEWQHADA